MKVYHMSDTLQLGEMLTNDYKKQMELTRPFVQALERSMDCFYGMMYSAKYMRAALGRFGMMDMPTNYVEWATEGIFEYVRKREFPESCCRLTCNYYFANIKDCIELFDIDWAGASSEERSRIRLFEVELDDKQPQRRDMRLFDQAFDAMWENEDAEKAFDCAGKYFSEEMSDKAVVELLSDKKAVAVKDISEMLRDR